LIPHAEARLWFQETPADSHGAENQTAAYRARKSDFSDKLVAVAETVIPDLRRHILFRAEATPVTFARYDWSSDGAIYGVAKAGRFKGSKSPIAGLVIAGSANGGFSSHRVKLSSEVEQVVLVLENSRYLARTLIERNSAGIFGPCFDAECQQIEHDSLTSESGVKHCSTYA
jgi:all-trans-retinol 13,14-reductase